MVRRYHCPLTERPLEVVLKLYRDATASRSSHAATKEYRRLFEQSIREFEDWLQGKELY